MRNKLAKGVLASVLAFAMVAPTAACGGTEAGSGDTTLIYVANFGGGIGRKWLDEAIVRFKAKIGDKSYEEGKTGVEFNITHNTNLTFTGTDVAGSGYHIFFSQGSNAKSLMQEGAFLEINDVVKSVVDQRNGVDITIEEKIPSESRYIYQASDGNYYGLPYYEYYDGLSYNVDTFNKYGLYLADPAAEGDPWACSLTNQTVMFVGETSARKSCGNDGVYGTYDDGLPTTLMEMVAMCDYMDDKGVIPFTVSKRKLVYSNKMLNGMWFALAGSEQARSAINFTGSADYVTGFSNDNLFAGNSTIKAPNIEENASISNATGYKAINQASRYYAAAFMELAVKQSWFDPRSTQDSFTHKDAMRAIMFSGIGESEEVGMLIEGTYWYNEAEGYGLTEEYKKYTQDQTGVDLQYFNMPTSLNEPVTEGNGRAEALAVSSGTYSIINGNLKDKADKQGIIEACKDFLKFLYTDEELRYFTKSTGARKGAMDYDASSIIDSLPLYKKSVMNASALNWDNRVVQSSQNKLYANNTGMFTWGDMSGWTPEFDAMDSYSTFLAAFREGKTATECFLNTGFTEEGWNAAYSKYFED